MLRAPAGPALALGLAAALAAANDPGFLGHAFRHPGSFALGGAAAAALYSGLVASALLAASWGLGRLALGLLRAPGLGAAPQALTEAALGAGLLGTAVLGVGLAAALTPRGLLLLAALAAAGLANAVRGLSGASAPRAPRMDAWGWALAGLLAYSAWHSLVTALAPPTDWDALAYHLSLPKLYLRAGRVLELPWLLHSHWPHLFETLAVLPLAARTPEAAALLHAASCAGLCFAVFAAGRKELGVAPAWTAAALLAAQPVVLRLAGTAHSDGHAALLSFLASWAAWRWLNGGGGRLPLLAGLLAGLAVSAKLLGVVHAGSLALALACWPGGRAGRERARALASFAAGLLVCLPWLLKSWVWAGNPVWPFLPGVFGGDWGAAALDGPYRASNLWSWPPAPGLLLRYGPQYLLVPFAALAAISWRGPRRWPPFARFLLAVSVPSALALGRHHEAWRFLLPHFPALALTSGWLAAQAASFGGPRRGLCFGALLLGFSPLLRATQNNQLFAVLGARSSGDPGADPRRLYLERSLDYFRFYGAVNAALGPGDKVLLFRDIRGYHLDVPYQWGDPVNQGLLPYAALSSPEALLAALSAQGITHVLVNAGVAMYGPGGGVYDERTLALMEGVLARHARRVLSDGALSLHRLEY